MEDITALAEGAAGDINIDSKNLAIQNGAWILASTLNKGKTGNIKINTADTFTLDGSGLITGSAVGSTGNVATLTIDSNNVLIQNGGVVSSTTLGQGEGGNISLTVADSMQLLQSLPNGIIPTGIYTNTVGDSGAAGDLTIDTSNLIIDGGSTLSSASGAITSQGLIPFGGQGGNIRINATESIEVKGSSPNNRFASGIVNDTYSNNSAGNILIHTGKLSLQDEALISASAIGTGDGGNLTILADDSVHLNGIGSKSLEQVFLDGLAGQIELKDIRGGLLSNTQTTGQAGNINIDSPRLTLDEDALISTSTLGQANGGDLNIVADNIEIFSSAIASSTLGTGKAGNITIETDQLTTAESGLIATSSIGFGDAGDLWINATKSIKLLDSSTKGLVSGGIFTTNPSGLGYPGNLVVNTKDLIIRGGATIDATNGAGSNLLTEIFQVISIPEEQLNLDLAKDVIINAESIDISGTSFNGVFIFNSGITSTTSSLFPASNIQINTSHLSIEDKGKIAVNSVGEGKAGNLEIIADSIYLNNYGNLNATTFSGRGGNIDLQVKNILSLTNNSEINTNALNFGDGGNIAADTTFVIAFGESRISANAISGQGGNISIEATDLFVAPDSQITASSELGIDGKVNIKTFTNIEHNSFTRLPEQIIEVDNLITQSCSGNNNSNGVFAYTGRGGLPPNPLTEYQSGDTVIADFDIPSNSIIDHKFEVSNKFSNRLNPPPQKIVEAEGWQINENGKIELVALASDNPIPWGFDFSSCPL